mmetsp:Transcript_14514/g.22898  ORF Transcript_14514/g.22898 Transcript_14514/m.22898 type:complete len:80 (-) Transcript_14514:64-303(-)
MQMQLKERGREQEGRGKRRAREAPLLLVMEEQQLGPVKADHQQRGAKEVLVVMMVGVGQLALKEEEVEGSLLPPPRHQH